MPLADEPPATACAVNTLLFTPNSHALVMLAMKIPAPVGKQPAPHHDACSAWTLDWLTDGFGNQNLTDD